MNDAVGVLISRGHVEVPVSESYSACNLTPDAFNPLSVLTT
jgi:hypothetical protein